MSINFHLAKFSAAYGTAKQLPVSTRPEVAFAGRSNVGKSSLLNKLMYRRGLAKVSATPGKTATINFYDVDGVDLVDLPGYGYAQVSKSEKRRWANLIEGYFNQERYFALVVALIDIRHAPSALDRNMIEFLRESGLNFAIVLTKADKLSKQQAAKQRAMIVRELGLPNKHYGKGGGRSTYKGVGESVGEGTDGNKNACKGIDEGVSEDVSEGVSKDAYKNADESVDTSAEASMGANNIPVIITSATNGRGIDELRGLIEASCE